MMKYNHYLNSEDRKLVLDAFIAADTNSGLKVSTEEELLQSALKICIDHMPDELWSLITQSDRITAFRKSMIEHLKINSYIIKKIVVAEEGERNITGFQKMSDYINEYEERNILGVISRSESSRTFQKAVEGIISKYFNIENRTFNSENITGYKDNLIIPFLVKPFIFFVTWINTLDKLGREDLSSKELRNIFISVIENYTEEQQLVSKYLFEKEYNVDLFESIRRTIVFFPANQREKVIELLSLISILPNVNFRPQLVEMMCRLLLNKDYNENDIIGHYGYYTSDDFADKINILQEAILYLAFITIPLAEIYFYDLIDKNCLEININEKYSEETEGDLTHILKAFENYSGLIDSLVNFHLKDFVQKQTEMKQNIKVESEDSLLDDHMEYKKAITNFIGAVKSEFNL